MLTKDENRQMFIDILDYAEKTKNFSFYELKAYAFDHKNEWIEFFENKKNLPALSACLKSKKHRLNTKVRPTYEAMEICLAAEQRYYKKHPESNE
jgi:hypothetical protein